jgi:hypothetical protein
MDQQVADRFENALKNGDNLRRQIQRNRRDDKWVDFEPYHRWQSQTVTLLKAVYGQESDYARNFEAATTYKGTPLAELINVERGMGVLTGAAEDFRNQWIWTYPERLRADVFGDLLETAEHLLKEVKCVDAAAVLAGGALEVHIKKLAQKHGVPIGKVAAMNWALWKQKDVYTQPEWHQVDGWYALRNDAAHQNPAPRAPEQVEQMIIGVRDFIVRHPA